MIPEQKPERIDLIQVFEWVHVTQMTACHVLGKSLVVNWMISTNDNVSLRGLRVQSSLDNLMLRLFEIVSCSIHTMSIHWKCWRAVCHNPEFMLANSRHRSAYEGRWVQQPPRYTESCLRDHIWVNFIQIYYFMKWEVWELVFHVRSKTWKLT